MLTIYEVTGQTDAKNYYGTSDYYSQGQETVGGWGASWRLSLASPAR